MVKSSIQEMKLNRRGIMVVLSSPSGAGKTTLTKQILNTSRNILMSVSATTRQPRPGEVDGEDYIFLSKSVLTLLVIYHCCLSVYLVCNCEILCNFSLHAH